MAAVEGGIISSVAVRLGLDSRDLENKINSVFVEVKRLGEGLQDLQGNLGIIGAAGASIFAGLLSFMPEVQRQIDLMDPAFEQLGRTLEDETAPKVGFFQEKLNELVAFIQQNQWIQDLISGFMILGVVIIAAVAAFALLSAIVGVLLNPWFWIAAGIALVIALFSSAIKTAWDLGEQIADLIVILANLDDELGGTGWTGNWFIDILLGIYRTVKWVIDTIRELIDWIGSLSDKWAAFSEEHPIISATLTGDVGGAASGAAQMFNDIKIDITTGDLGGDVDLDELGDKMVGKLADYFSQYGGS